MLGSGKGSNFVAIADAVATGQIPAEIAVVLSDVETAGILAHARDRKIPAQFVPPGKFRTKLDEDAERAFVTTLQEAQVVSYFLHVRVRKPGLAKNVGGVPSPRLDVAGV